MQIHLIVAYDLQVLRGREGRSAKRIERTNFHRELIFLGVFVLLSTPFCFWLLSLELTLPLRPKEILVSHPLSLREWVLSRLCNWRSGNCFIRIAFSTRLRRFYRKMCCHSWPSKRNKYLTSSSSPNVLWFNSSWGRRPNGLLTQYNTIQYNTMFFILRG